MQYYLSKRQLKELANGKRLQIALPDPTGSDAGQQPDPSRWAASVLQDVDATWIRAAARESIEVFSEAGQASQLADEIGSIYLANMPQTDRLHWWVEVIVVTICQRDKPRSTYPIQWPARYTL
jgi:hypothetical protein